jgi:hypothetical protein
LFPTVFALGMHLAQAKRYKTAPLFQNPDPGWQPGQDDAQSQNTKPALARTGRTPLHKNVSPGPEPV